MIKGYQIKSGPYAGMWHLRDYIKGKYTHVARVKTKREADELIGTDHVPKERIMPVPIKPLRDLVVVTLQKDVEQTLTGLLLGNTDQNTKRALVNAKGPNVTEVVIGDIILLDVRDAFELSYQGTDYMIIEEKYILGTHA